MIPWPLKELFMVRIFGEICILVTIIALKQDHIIFYITLYLVAPALVANN